MKALEITRHRLAPQPMLFIRRVVEQAQLQSYFAECFGKLFGHAIQAGLAITGNPIARYVAMGPGYPGFSVNKKVSLLLLEHQYVALATGAS